MDIESIYYRPTYLKSPCWRWNLIMAFLADPTMSVDKAYADTYLHKGIKFYRDRKVLMRTYKICENRHPDVTAAFNIFNNNHNGGLRWWVEALIMGGLSSKDIVKRLALRENTSVIDAYKKLFFDVEDYLKSDILTFSNVISTSRFASGSDRDCDFTWKWFSYCWGGQSFLDEFTPKKKDTIKAHERWLKAQVKERIAMHSFGVAHDLQRNCNEDAINVMRLAKEYWTIGDDQVAEIENEVVQSFASELIGKIDQSLVAANIKMPTVEMTTFSKLPAGEDMSNAFAISN